MQLLIAAVVITAATYDILYRRIPNWLVLPCWLIGFVLNSYLFGWAGLRSAVLGFGVAMLFFFPLWLLQGMAAGDVKLMAAVGALAGPFVWLWIFVFSGIVGGIVAIILMIVHRRLRKTLSNVGFLIWDLLRFRAPYLRSEEMRVDSPRSFRLPHGAVFALGYLAFLGFALFSGTNPFWTK